MGCGGFGQAENGNEDFRRWKVETKSRVTVVWRQRSGEQWVWVAVRWGGGSRISGLQMEHEPPGEGVTVTHLAPPHVTVPGPMPFTGGVPGY